MSTFELTSFRADGGLHSGAGEAASGLDESASEAAVFRSMTLRWVVGNLAIFFAATAFVAGVAAVRGGALLTSEMTRSLFDAGRFSAFAAIVGAGIAGVVASFGVARRTGVAVVHLGLAAMASLYLVRVLPVLT